jgi:hypothetical protein
MIRVVHPGSDPDLLPIPDPGSRGQKGTGSRIRIRNTVYKLHIIFTMYVHGGCMVVCLEVDFSFLNCGWKFVLT